MNQHHARSTLLSVHLLLIAGFALFFVARGELRAVASDAAASGQGRPAPLRYLISMVHHNIGEPLFITKYVRPDYLRQLGPTQA